MTNKKLDFGRLGFDHYQSVDLRILMSLKTSEDMQEWAAAVGPEDVCYGLALIECAALALLDEDVAAMSSWPEALAVINSARG